MTSYSGHLKLLAFSFTLWWLCTDIFMLLCISFPPFLACGNCIQLCYWEATLSPLQQELVYFAFLFYHITFTRLNYRINCPSLIISVPYYAFLFIWDSSLSPTRPWMPRRQRPCFSLLHFPRTQSLAHARTRVLHKTSIPLRAKWSKTEGWQRKKKEKGGEYENHTVNKFRR